MMKKKQKNEKKRIDKNKAKYILKLFIITIIVTILLEFIYVFIKSIKESSKTEFKEFNERIVEVDEGYLIVGSSNFKYSKLNSRSGKYEKPRIAIYNDQDELKTEIKYKKGYNGLFTDIVENDNSYVAIGVYQKTNSEYKKNETEALIVKYDKDGNIIWENDYKKLSNTKFNKIISIEDGYIVVGSSTYASTERATEQAGALISKYDKNGKMLWEEYYGNNRTASFNDILEVEDGYIVVGSKEANIGIIAKYDKEGLFKWKKEIENIGNHGLSKITRYKNQFIIIGSFKKSTYVQNKTNTALIMLTDLKGSLIKYVEYGDEQTVSQWNDLLVHDNYLYVVGVSSYVNKELSNEKMTYYNNKAIYAKYDMYLNVIEKNEVDKNKTYQYTSLIEKDKKLYITGYTNAKCNIKYADGVNYVSFVEHLQTK